MLDRLRGLSVADIAGLLSLILAVIVAVVPPLRRSLTRVVLRVRFAVGGPGRAYADWFLQEHGRYDNPYLGDVEDLDLRRTFVSLYMRDADGGPDVRQPAADVVARREPGAVGAKRHMMIEGDPGSGKSTLLKAFGVASLRASTPTRFEGIDVQSPEIPFFVPLRKLGEHLANGRGIDRYVIEEILVNGVGMRLELARTFFQRALGANQCLLLLDGLDEVTDTHYRAVLNEVHRFIGNRAPDMPTHQARLVITCRRQNLMVIQDEWVGPIAERSYRLAPFRNADIYRYLDNVRKAFKLPRGPEDFMVALRNSRTIELHRTPLVLSMSVGLFAKKDYYEIPHSISDLYQRMVKEMLDRHRFRDDPLGSANRFRAQDKYIFLRAFAYQAASGSSGFDEVSRGHLVAAAHKLARSLEAVPADQVDAFVSEIIDRSGLLSLVDDRRFVFAHRSIQEHLVAEELLRGGDFGATSMIERVPLSDWRQVVLFYTAAAEQSRMAMFMPDLANKDLVLAGQCLAGANVPDEIATDILQRIAGQIQRRRSVAAHLSALLAATSSPRLVVQRAAVDTTCDVLNGLIAKRTEVLTALGGDISAVARVLNTIADANTRQVAGLLPALAAVIPDDPALVEPLWRCLATDGIEQDPARIGIIDRLVSLVMDPDCLAELLRLDPHSPVFVTAQLRDKVYPFTYGHPRSSNLVTLLAWVDHLGIEISRPNRFLEAKAAGPKAFAGVERSAKRLGLDRNRSTRWRTWYVAFFGYLATVAAAAVLLAVDPAAILGTRGVWNLPILAAPILLSMVLNVTIQRGAAVAPMAGVYRSQSHRDGFLIRARRWRPFLAGAGQRSEPRRLFAGQWLLLDVAVAAPSAVAFAPLTSKSIAGYVVVATLAIAVIRELPRQRIVERFLRWRFHVPQYVDLYQDKRSRPWVVPEVLTERPARRPTLLYSPEATVPLDDADATIVLPLATVRWSERPARKAQPTKAATPREADLDTTIILPRIAWTERDDTAA